MHRPPQALPKRAPASERAERDAAPRATCQSVSHGTHSCQHGQRARDTGPPAGAWMAAPAPQRFSSPQNASTGPRDRTPQPQSWTMRLTRRPSEHSKGRILRASWPRRRPGRAHERPLWQPAAGTRHIHPLCSNNRYGLIFSSKYRPFLLSFSNNSTEKWEATFTWFQCISVNLTSYAELPTEADLVTQNKTESKAERAPSPGYCCAGQPRTTRGAKEHACCLEDTLHLDVLWRTRTLPERQRARWVTGMKPAPSPATGATSRNCHLCRSSHGGNFQKRPTSGLTLGATERQPFCFRGNVQMTTAVSPVSAATRDRPLAQVSKGLSWRKTKIPRWCHHSE